MTEWVTVAQKNEVPEGEGLCVEAAGERIALFNIEGQIYAITDICPHAGGSLSDGWLDEHEVCCPWHGWTFDLKGEPGPGADGATRYRVSIEGEEIKVEIPEQ
jgi:nitrite reductase/ring-hydroxylating ferredoxin subunit